ncbi:MAG: hypothetical protein MRJ93_14045 [Nitrososphaeraceae archaeon]|nr:hypothetical protein [Nitrososphaeraceae archaeon]
MKNKLIPLLVMLPILYFLPTTISAQYAEDSMITHMRQTHNILEKNVGEVISLIKSNHTSEALNLLEGVKIKVNHIDSLFDDFIWTLSNKGH